MGGYNREDSVTFASGSSPNALTFLKVSFCPAWTKILSFKPTVMEIYILGQQKFQLFPFIFNSPFEHFGNVSNFVYICADIQITVGTYPESV